MSDFERNDQRVWGEDPYVNSDARDNESRYSFSNSGDSTNTGYNYSGNENSGPRYRVNSGAGDDSDPRYQRPQPRKKKKSGAGKKVFATVGFGVLFGIVSGVTMVGVNTVKDHVSPSSTSQIEVTTPTTEEAQGTMSSTKGNVVTTDVTNVVEQVMPSVVSINCTIQSTNYFYGTQESQGAGSGFIIAKDKDKLYIATNNHVVAGATSLKVAFNDGATAPAQVVGTDKDADLGVISVEAKDISAETAKAIKVAVLGESDNLKVGQPVIAIGNALGYGQSVTTGVISAKNREVSFADGSMTLLQTDAAINPGNSGGVLINLKGEVIGINNAKLADTSVEGMGYAIPMTTAKEILTDLMNVTTIKEKDQAFLGVVGKNIDSTYSEALGIPSGIYVSQVVSGSPAESAGISAGDVITEYEGSAVSTMEGLKEKLSRKKAGTKITLKLQRSNQNGQYEEKTVEVKLGKKKDFEETSNEIQQQNPNGQETPDSQETPNGQENPQGQDGYQQNPYEDGQGEQYIDPFEYFFGNGGGSFFR